MSIILKKEITSGCICQCTRSMCKATDYIQGTSPILNQTGYEKLPTFPTNHNHWKLFLNHHQTCAWTSMELTPYHASSSEHITDSANHDTVPRQKLQPPCSRPEWPTPDSLLGNASLWASLHPFASGPRQAPWSRKVFRASRSSLRTSPSVYICPTYWRFLQ